MATKAKSKKARRVERIEVRSSDTYTVGGDK